MCDDPDGHDEPAPDAGGHCRSRVNVQTWGNPHSGFTSYVPESDVQATASTFDEARIRAIEKHKEKISERYMPVETAPRTFTPAERWNCPCGHSGIPDKRPDCPGCSSPRL